MRGVYLYGVHIYMGYILYRGYVCLGGIFKWGVYINKTPTTGYTENRLFLIGSPPIGFELMFNATRFLTPVGGVICGDGVC